MNAPLGPHNLQEYLSAGVVQLAVFDFRNAFFRRTMKLDLLQFSEDQGATVYSVTEEFFLDRARDATIDRWSADLAGRPA